MSNVERENEGKELPTLDSLVENAVGKLNAHATFENGEPFTMYSAAQAAIRESLALGVPLDHLVQKIIGETSLKPKEADSSGWEAETWDEVYENIATGIVGAELMRKYPEVEEEAYQRLEKWESSRL